MFLLASLEISMGWEEHYTPLLGQCLQTYRGSAAGFRDEYTAMLFCLKHPKIARIEHSVRLSITRSLP